MKALVVCAAVVVLASAGLQAQGSSPGMENQTVSPLARNSSYESCDLNRLERGLMISLNHEIDGIVVNALREVAKIKLAQPECESIAIRNKVNELVRDGASMAVRYKAYLTAIVLADPGQFAAEGQESFNTDEQFFCALALNLQHVALSDAR